MKRKELIQKLMENGFSEKTLVTFNDKQLSTLGSKILKEEDANSAAPTGVVNIPSSDAAAIQDAKVKKKKFVTYEGEMAEEEKPSAGLSKEKKSEIVKKAKKGEDIGKKGKGFDKLADKAAKEYGSKEKGEKVAAAAMWKNAKKSSKKLNEWVESLVEKRFHPIVTKNELVETIKSKFDTMETAVIPMPKKAKIGHNGIPEFMTYDAITAAEPKTKPAQPGTLPKTKPAEPRENPRKSPFKKPDTNPRVNPNPKAEKLQNAAE